MACLQLDKIQVGNLYRVGQKKTLTSSLKIDNQVGVILLCSIIITLLKVFGNHEYSIMNGVFKKAAGKQVK